MLSLQQVEEAWAEWAEWGPLTNITTSGRTIDAQHPGPMLDVLVATGREIRRALRSPRTLKRLEQRICRELVEQKRVRTSKGQHGWPFKVTVFPNGGSAKAWIALVDEIHRYLAPWVHSDDPPPPPEPSNHIVDLARQFHAATNRPEQTDPPPVSHRPGSPGSPTSGATT